VRARHRLRAAAVEYEKLRRSLGPGNPQVAARLARTYLELGDPERAIKTAEPALELHPDQGGVSATLGEALLKKGDAARQRRPTSWPRSQSTRSIRRCMRAGKGSTASGAMPRRPREPSCRCSRGE